MTFTFFSVAHNSSYSHRFPWLWSIEQGTIRSPKCSTCGGSEPSNTGDQVGHLEEDKGSAWPDVLGAATGLFMVSARVLRDWHRAGIENVVKGGRVSFLPPIPKRLESLAAPEYQWIDGSKMTGARFDAERSGFVYKGRCHACGRLIQDVTATHERRHSGRLWPHVLVPGSWNGADLFTTEGAPWSFYCTMRVVECAREHRHTNFRFVPIEAGAASWSAGIDYLGRQWPPQFRLRPSEGKSLSEWLDRLRHQRQRYEARRAIIDLGTDAASAVETLTGMLHDEDEGLRREASLLLSALGKLGVPLGQEGESAARKHDEWFQSTLGGQTPREK